MTKRTKGQPKTAPVLGIREDWLTRAVERLRPLLSNAGYTVPQYVRVAVGFPSRGGLPGVKQRIGECWYGGAAADKLVQIYISPVIGEGLRALDVLVHELLHSCLPEGTGHKGPFKAGCKKLGLAGKPTATHASPELEENLRNVMEGLGPYPHAELRPLTKLKKQTTRLLKVTCPTCGYTVRVTSKWLDVGAPVCPTDDISMELDGDSEDAPNYGE